MKEKGKDKICCILKGYNNTIINKYQNFPFLWFGLDKKINQM